MDIWVLDDKYETVTICDTFDSIVWTTRYNDVGEAEIVTYPFDNILETVQMGSYLMQKNSDRYMIVEDLEIVEDTEQGDTITFRVEDLASILKRRVINTYTSFNCPVRSAISSLLNTYFVNPSDAKRKIPNFTTVIPSGGRFDVNIETVFLGETVYEAITALCQATDLGYKVLPYGAGGFKFELYEGVDRSYNQNAVPAVIFSDTFENLLNTRFHESLTDYKNVMYIGGEGEGPEKFIVEIGSGSGLNRRETWAEISATRRTDEEDADGNPIDLTDEQYSALLKEKGAVELAEYKAIKAFDGEIDAERQFVLGEDFFIGDIVQVVNKWGYENVCRISEIVECEDDSDGHRYYPTFSSLEQNY